MMRERRNEITKLHSGRVCEVPTRMTKLLAPWGSEVFIRWTDEAKENLKRV